MDPAGRVITVDRKVVEVAGHLYVEPPKNRKHPSTIYPRSTPAGWRDEHGNGAWTWHSLRHIFRTTALFTWKLDATDVSRMAGHANYRLTLDM